MTGKKMDFLTRVNKKYVLARRVMRWGTMPTLSAFDKAFQEKFNGYFKLKLREDAAEVIRRAGVDPNFETNNSHELYKVIEKLAMDGATKAGYAASDIMSKLGWTWAGRSSDEFGKG